MTRILIVYSSRHGHTGKIARRLASLLGQAGAEPLVLTAEQAHLADPAHFDGVIVGGSVHRAHHDAALLDWVRTHRYTLSGRPTGFFSVSMTAVTDPEEARRYLDVFVEDADWTPDRVLVLAGALEYPAYSPATRQLVHAIAWSRDLATDTRRTVEYTDWEALEQFAARFMRRLRRTERERGTSPMVVPG